MTSDISKVTEDSARGGFFLLFGAAISSIILAVSTILMGRFLGPELYGQYNLILVIPTLLLLFTDLGINAGVTKFVASLRAEGKNERIPAIIRNGMILRLIIGVLISIVSLLFASYFALLINRPDFSFYIQISCLSVIFQVIFTTSNSALVGIDKSEFIALNSSIRAILTTILQVSLVVLSFSVMGALLGFVLGFAVSSVLAFAMLFFKMLRTAPERKILAGEKSRDIFMLLARYGLPVYISVVLIGFFPLYQQVVLAFFASDAAIGNFRAAFNFVTLLTVISASITTALLPAFSKIENSAPEVVNDFFNKANKYTTLIIVPTTICVIMFSGPIVTLLYGSVYTSASLFLSLSCSVYLLSIIGSLTLLSVFNGLGKTRLTMNMTLINFVILLFLTPVLAIAYDVIGVIIASLIASVVASVYAAVVAVRQLGIKFSFGASLRIYSLSVFSALPPLALVLFTKLSFTLVLFAGGVLYLFVFITLMPILKIVSPVELATLTQVTGRIPLLNLIAVPMLKYQKRVGLLTRHFP
jgi:stage V sporulation protein B